MPVSLHLGPHYQSHWVPHGKRVLAALLAVVCLVVAGGCQPGPPGPVALVFKHARILGPANPIPALLAEFEARHPGVRVIAESLPWSSDEQRQFFVINLEGGQPGFDVMMLDVIWVPEFARAGWLLDLTPHLAPDELAPHFPAAVEAARFEGRTWALPWFMTVGLLYYRRDLLDRHGLEPPETYDELVAQVRRVQGAETGKRVHGFLWQGKQYEGLVVNVLEHLWAAGTELIGTDGAVLPDPGRAAGALAFLRMLVDSGLSPGWVTAADEELSRRPFGQGDAIFLRNWPYAMDLFQGPDSPVRGKVGMARLPRHRDGHEGAGSTGGAHLAVQRVTRHPEAAVALARFLSSEPAQRAIARGAALSPTRMDLYADPVLVREHPWMPELRELMLAGRPRPVTPYYLMMSTMLQPELSAALVGVKSPTRVVADARRSLGFLLRDLAGGDGPRR